MSIRPEGYFVIREFPDYIINSKGHILHAKTGVGVMVTTKGRGKNAERYVNFLVDQRIKQVDVNQLIVNNIPPF